MREARGRGVGEVTKVELPAPRNELDRLHTNAQAQDLLIGKVINEQYRIVEKLGGGGMGSVYLAEQTSDKRKVAIKFLSEAVATLENRTRFSIEAGAMAQVNHPNVVKVIDFDLYENRPFLVMEYLEGTNVSSLLKKDGRVAWERTIEIVKQICDGLQAAHDKRMIHRDMKPGNVIILTDGNVKIIDFGLTKFEGPQEDSGLTRTGYLIGTPIYMSPEQYGKEGYDHRVDVYAVGIVLYEMLTGTVPFRDADPVAILDMHRNKTPQKPSERRPDASIPKWLEEIVMHTLEKDPNKRFQSMNELKDAIMKGEGRFAVRSDDVVPRAGAIVGLDLDAPIAAPLQSSGKVRKQGGFFGKAAIFAALGATVIVGYLQRNELLSRFRSQTQPTTTISEPPAPPVEVQTREIWIETEPKDTRIYQVLNRGSETQIEMYVGNAPLQITIETGQQTFIVKKPGYRAQTITVSPNQNRVNVSLARVRPVGRPQRRVRIIEVEEDGGVGQNEPTGIENTDERTE